jgi:hypothetical protein
MKAPSSAARETAEMLAIQALSFIAAEPERFNRFLGTTGLTLGRRRESANEPDFLAGVLEHRLADESQLLAFADNASVNPEDAARARKKVVSTECSCRPIPPYILDPLDENLEKSCEIQRC